MLALAAETVVLGVYFSLIKEQRISFFCIFAPLFSLSIMMKKSIILLVLAFITLSMSAESDFDIAQSFMNKKGIKLVPNERSLTRGTDVPYRIFNGAEDKGFCIVVNGKVVGYDTIYRIRKSK